VALSWPEIRAADGSIISRRGSHTVTPATYAASPLAAAFAGGPRNGPGIRAAEGARALALALARPRNHCPPAINRSPLRGRRGLEMSLPSVASALTPVTLLSYRYSLPALLPILISPRSFVFLSRCLYGVEMAIPWLWELWG